MPEATFTCYGSKGTPATRGAYRPIGINRNSQLAVLQLRPYAQPAYRAVQWMAFGSNSFNALIPYRDVFRHVKKEVDAVISEKKDLSRLNPMVRDAILGKLVNPMINGV